jgi:hypothetical protein
MQWSINDRIDVFNGVIPISAGPTYFGLASIKPIMKHLE